MIVPHVSFAQSQRYFLETAYTNERCLGLPNNFYDSNCKDVKSRDICCNFNCYNGKCENPKRCFGGSEINENVSLRTGVIYLCLTPILWFLFLIKETNREWKCKNEKNDDEPTVGVDTGAKRSLWNLIKAHQVTGQTVILSSKNTEECEVLCDKLAIMVDGKFACIGAPGELKQRYGAGYDVQIKLDTRKAESQLDSIKRDMNRMLNGQLIDGHSITLLYHIAPAGTTFRRMYNVMNEIKSKYVSIVDVLITSSLRPLLPMFPRAAPSRSTLRSTN